MRALFFLLLPTLGAVPKGYTDLNHDKNGCTYYIGPTLPSGYASLRGECEWTNLSAERLDSLLSNLTLHDEIFEVISETTLLGQGEGGTLIRQVHVTSGLSDRQVDLVFKREVKGDTIIHHWTKASTQSPGDRVEPDTDNGRWEFTPMSTGGVRVVSELLYEPGGTVPGFVVRWFQNTGFVQIVEDLRVYALTKR